jgi:RNase P subunit RPR2
MITPEPYKYELFGRKVCPKCDTPLPANTDFFAPSKLQPDGLYWECRDCKNQRARENYRRDPERHIAADRARRQRMKMAS